MTTQAMHSGVNRWLSAGIAALCLFVLPAPGCRGGKARAAPQAKPSGSQPATAAKEPDAELNVPAVQMVTTIPVKRPDAYDQRVDVPSGTLKGFCFAAGPQVKPPPPELWDFTNSKLDADEVAYYQNLRIPKSAEVYAEHDQNRRQYAIHSAVILVVGVKAGPKAMLTRPGFTAAKGQVTCQRVSGYGLTGIGFGPVGERALFATVDAYPCHFVVTRAGDGQVVFEGDASAYRDAKLKPGERPDPRAFTPALLQSTPLDAGLYVITCRRHPWQKAHLWIVENPYVAESRAGLFQIDSMPVGRHRVTVWHPALQPVRNTFQVEIKKNEIAELAVEFRLPPHLSAATAPAAAK